MALVYNKVYAISDRLGVTTHIDFSFKDRAGNVTTVIPRPKAGSPPISKMMSWEKQGNVEVNNGDKYITGISKTFDNIIEGTVCNIDGRKYTILWIDREQTVTYNLLVRPERSR